MIPDTVASFGRKSRASHLYRHTSQNYLFKFESLWLSVFVQNLSTVGRRKSTRIIRLLDEQNDIAEDGRTSLNSMSKRKRNAHLFQHSFHLSHFGWNPKCDTWNECWNKCAFIFLLELRFVLKGSFCMSKCPPLTGLMRVDFLVLRHWDFARMPKRDK